MIGEKRVFNRQNTFDAKIIPIIGQKAVLSVMNFFVQMPAFSDERNG
jgi:hypothetical protein